MELAKPLVTVTGTRIPTPSAGRISIEVRPRDAVVLRQICANLEEEITSAPVSSSYELAEVLAHVKDPVAVPFLTHLLQTNDKMASVFAGLERIGDASAIERYYAMYQVSLKIDARVSGHPWLELRRRPVTLHSSARLQCIAMMLRQPPSWCFTESGGASFNETSTLRVR